MTEQAPTTSGDAGTADDEFDAGRLRTVAAMRRSKDDRMVAGVCAGAARYLRIDPVVVRVIVASLTFVGLSGVIIYVAAWVLLPEEGDDEGMIDSHLPEHLDREQVRRLGLFVAGVIAVVSMLGAGFTFSWPTIPITLAVLAVFYVFAVLPYNRRRAAGHETPTDDLATAGVPADAEPGEVTFTPAPHPPGSAPPLADKPPAPPRPRNPRRDHGALLGLTVAVAVVVLGAMWVYSETSERIEWPYFPLAAFAVVTVGMLVGTVFGNGRPLTLLAIPLAVLLLATTVLPTYTIGDDKNYPAYASDVDSSYQQGIGNFVLDLTEVQDPGALNGRTVKIEQGMGSLEVIVPDGVDVDIEAETDAGQLKVFGQNYEGAPVTRHHVDPSSGDPDLRLDLSQTTGQIRVTRS